MTPLDSPILFRRRRRSPDGEMDITPMIDVVFLLLIFFLVCSAMGKHSSVQLPEAKHGVPISPRTAVVLTLAGMENQSTVYLGDETGKPLPADHQLQRDMIVHAIEQGLKEGKTDVMIRADKKLCHGEVVRIESIAATVAGINLFVVIKD